MFNFQRNTNSTQMEISCANVRNEVIVISISCRQYGHLIERSIRIPPQPQCAGIRDCVINGVQVQINLSDEDPDRKRLNVEICDFVVNSVTINIAVSQSHLSVPMSVELRLEIIQCAIRGNCSVVYHRST